MTNKFQITIIKLQIYSRKNEQQEVESFIKKVETGIADEVYENK